MIEFILMVNKQGYTRLAQYYTNKERNERVALEAEIVRKCLARADNQCSFFEYRNIKVIYRRYASLFFIFGVDNDENEMGILEFIHNMVETLDRYFDSVCELDVSFQTKLYNNKTKFNGKCGDDIICHGYLYATAQAVIS
eukprot:gene20431-22445_t